MTKIEKFSPSKEKKAYSYFGTICKNYLMGQIIKDQKDTNRKISYEDISSNLENRPDMVYYIDNDMIEAEDIINKFKIDLRLFMDNNEMTHSERKLGEALIVIFDNYEETFPSSDNNKFNKNVILLTLREMTNLSTKEIRSSIKKFKKLYGNTLNGMID
jgi:hypothetical protein